MKKSHTSHLSSNTFILELILYREQPKFSFYFYLRSKITEKFTLSLKDLNETIFDSLFQFVAFKYHTPIKKGTKSRNFFIPSSMDDIRTQGQELSLSRSLSLAAWSHCNEKSYRVYRSGGPPRLFFINRWNEL